MHLRSGLVAAVGALVPMVWGVGAAMGTISAFSNSGPIEDLDTGDFLTFSVSASSADAFDTPGFTGPNSVNSLATSGQARIVHGGMRAFATATSTGSHSYASIGTTAGGSFTDIVTISTTLPITEGTFVALVWMSGSVTLNDPGSVSASATVGVESSLGSDQASISLTQNNPFASGYQLIQIPIVFGEPFQVYGSVSASASAGSDFNLGGGSATADFSSTGNWGGISEVRDSAGNLIEDWEIGSESGQDYRNEIIPPEIPGPGVLGALGIAMCGAMARRR